MQTSLPEKYYLEHAHEIFDHVVDNSVHLLEPQHLDFIAGFKQLNEDAQCILVRCWARKPDFIKRSTLDYAEIYSIEASLNESFKAGYMCSAQSSDWPNLVYHLTKPQLLQSLNNAMINAKLSANKSDLLRLAQDNLTGQERVLSELFNSFVVRRKRQSFDYILFLFFGDLRNRFQQFAMRDLGVMKTRKSTKTVARFDSLIEAKSAFDMQLQSRALLQKSTSTLELAESVGDYLISQTAIGSNAQKTKDRLLLNVGEQIVHHNYDKAIRLWRASNDPKATEKWARQSYASGNKMELKNELEQLCNQELDANSKVFIEDFYARKYLGKRTSVYTDMLREPARVIDIDEAYVSDVEQGVINYYEQHGAQAVFTENEFWCALFALVFWDCLYGEAQPQFSEFDRLPAALRNNDFYSKQRNQIEQCLEQLQDTDNALLTLMQRTITHYGKPTGLFFWSTTIVDTLRLALKYGDTTSFSKVLRRITKNYTHCKDGYPDLMVIENNNLRFEEVKAPGDVLRSNQLVSINRLRESDVPVDVSQVRWATNPNQVYAVVDIETTGGRKGGNAITEVAVVQVRNQEVINEWSTLVNPQRRIPEHITRLTGINNSMVANAPLFCEIADQLEAQLDGCIFVAHNVGFDYGFIKAAYESIGRSFRKPKYCTVSNSRKTFPRLKSYSLAALTEYFDIDLLGHHRALADAQATAHLLRLIQSHNQQQR